MKRILDAVVSIVLLLLLILLMIINYHLSPPVTWEELYNMPVEEAIKHSLWQEGVERTLVHFNKAEDALERLFCLNRLDKTKGMELSLSEYINAIKKADSQVMEFLQGLKIGE